MLEHLVHSPWLLPAAKETYKSRAQIATAWERAVTQIKGKKMEIAVTGLSGAGKSVLFDHLTEKAFVRGYRPPDRSLSLEKGKIPAQGFRINLKTIPGQASRPRLAALSEVFEAKKPVDGVIHVVSNGFVSLRESAASQVLIYDRGVDTVDKLRQYFLQEELSDLEETLGYVRRSLGKSHKPKWMLVAVAKSDLFYDNVAEAERYYSPSGSGPFVEKMQQFVGQVGSDNFDWDAFPVAAWLEDFTWGTETRRTQFTPEQRDHYVGQFAQALRNTVEAKERLTLSEHDPGTSPAEVAADTHTPSIRDDFEGLLELAEKLQQSLEKHTDALRQSRVTGQLGYIGLILGLTAGLLDVIGNWPHPLVSHSIAFAVNVLIYGVSILGVVTGGKALLLMLPRIDQLRREIRQDKRDLAEVVELLREIEPVFAREENLSVLGRVGIRIRLSRFGVGPSAREGAVAEELKTDVRPRPNRADQVAKPL